MKIIKYKVFNSSEEFESWQENNYDKIEIYQIQHMIFDYNNFIMDDDGSVKYNPNIGLFITYTEY